MRDGLYTAIGLMSGTSLDGIDAAILITDGDTVSEIGAAISMAYDDKFKSRLKEALARAPDLIGHRDQTADQAILELEYDLTAAHAGAVSDLLSEAAMAPQDIDIIGFHGQTICHAPQAGQTWQLGDGAQLAGMSGIDVINDLRTNDMAAGGEGAPLAPIYHLAMVQGRTPLERIIILNVGGVANLTWIDLAGEQPRLVAFDTGPGNALIDDWMNKMSGQAFDQDGKVASQGSIDHERVTLAMQHDYFKRPPPKSLDRNAFSLNLATGLDLNDGAATLTAFTVAAVEQACTLLPAAPEACFVSGGGRHNPVLMTGLQIMLGMPVEPVEVIGLRGDSIEAELMAFLAVRSLNGLALTYPETTGVESPCPGGHLHRVPGHL